MTNKIPTYRINNLSSIAEKKQDILFSDHTEGMPKLPIEIPYRSEYYGFSICVKGTAILKANLDTFTIEKNCIITMSPQVVKQWLHISTDYETLTVFFTKDFLINTNIDTFPFFHVTIKHVSNYTIEQCESILALLKTIKQKFISEHPYKQEILKNLIGNLLFEFAAIYDKEVLSQISKQTRSQQISIQFKKLVCIHYLKERSVKFYAEQLFVTSKHLTETIKLETGKSAGEWIGETIILEAKLLLQNTSLSVNQIADTLHFSDASTFSKFFKNLTSFSPIAYRKSL